MATYNDILPQEILKRLDIVEIVSETVNLNRKGNRYWGLCPFHQEKTASFCVTPEKNMFYCFGCHAGGDIFSFVMKRDNVEFKDALEYLAGKAGLTLEKSRPGGKNESIIPVLEVNRAAVEFYQQILTSREGTPVREYLRRRGIDTETIEKYQLGYAPDEWGRLRDYLLRKGYAREHMLLSGLLKRSTKKDSYYDLLRGRLIFPIRDYNGDIVGLGGRVLESSLPKYLNTPETELFSKRKILYGLFQAKDALRQANEAIVVEGYIDCIKLQQSGINNVVATMGTALTSEQARLLQRYCEKALLLYDGDEAGQRETLRAIEIMGIAGNEVSVVSLPLGEDPDDYIDKHGKEEFLRYIQNNRLSNIEFKMNSYLSQEVELNLKAQIGVIDYLREDIGRLNSEIEKDYYVRMLARRLRIEENLVYRELKKQGKRTPGIKRNKSKIIRDNIKYANYSDNEKIVAAMFKNPGYFEQIKSQIGLGFLQEEDLRALAQIYEGLAASTRGDLELFALAANQQGLGSSFARLALLMEEEDLPGEIEIQLFMRKTKREIAEQAWKRQFSQIENLREEGDFYSLLRFILNLNSFIKISVRKGGKDETG